MLGDCPTLFPLPALTPGSEQYLGDGDALPTHVHKAGSGNDQVQVGTWVDGAPGPKGTPGTWVQFPGSTSVPCDNGNTHASKDFYDPVKKRRILWIWGTVPSGIQALPRVMTYVWHEMQPSSTQTFFFLSSLSPPLWYVRTLLANVC